MSRTKNAAAESTQHATDAADAVGAAPNEIVGPRARIEREATANLAALTRLMPPPPVAPSAPAEPVGSPDVQRDLDALARCLGALLGSAMPIVRIHGGQGAGSPAEHVQQHLTRARRALGRLAGLRETHYGHVLVLLYAYVRLGDEHRRVEGWQGRVRDALLPRALSGARRADARASAVLGARLVLAAEDAYVSAAEVPSDGRWLATDLEAVAELALRGPRVPRAVPRPSHDEPDECARCALVAGDPCPIVQRRRARARKVGAACVGSGVGESCPVHPRWRVHGGTLLPSRSARVDVVEGGAGSSWALLRDAAESRVR
jgi:hypothetical protein